MFQRQENSQDISILINKNIVMNGTALGQFCKLNQTSNRFRKKMCEKFPIAISHHRARNWFIYILFIHFQVKNKNSAAGYLNLHLILKTSNGQVTTRLKVKNSK